MKHTACLLILLLAYQTADSYEIELSRTFNKVLVDNNQLLVKMSSDGLIEISYPEFYKDAKQLNFKASAQKMSVIDQLVERVDQKVTSAMLKNKLKIIKRNHNLPLFYASDVDEIELKITDESGSTWSLSLDNLTELKQHYEFMGQWQPVIDLINEMQSWSKQTVKNLEQGGAL
jgi:hypothetical protein